MIVLLCIVSVFFFFNDTATTEIYTLSLHDALPIYYQYYYHSVYYLHIVVPCNTTKECQIWNDGTYCAEGVENIKHTNKTCYCAMMSKLNRKTGACIGELGIIFGPLNIL